ncbi:sigma-70 family RNA polymerase sigma factor [Streptomyces sp. WAC 05379]|uniref:sigma-70 family RNA polymerase sigma factor n=1 Tax=Streptomyces sp. WAC 05379 TaxID=2203207 RepID=UPI00163B91D8|nr:sigma factor-like helix-turn-helix DNA-binding protein [Streptomyces sp. WAC 05379]
MARRAARRVATGGAHLEDELLQVARIAAWEALGRYDDTHGARLETFLWATVEARLQGAVLDEVTSGTADHHAVSTYGRMLARADGDASKAERLCQTEPEPGHRLSAERAHAARLAWSGMARLDAPVAHGEPGGATLGERLAEPVNDPQEATEGPSLAVVVLRAVLGTLSPLRRDVITMRYGLDGHPADMSVAEIARALGRGTDTVSDALRKGMAQLRRMLPEVALAM